MVNHHDIPIWNGHLRAQKTQFSDAPVWLMGFCIILIGGNIRFGWLLRLCMHRMAASYWGYMYNKVFSWRLKYFTWVKSSLRSDTDDNNTVTVPMLTDHGSCLKPWPIYCWWCSCCFFGDRPGRCVTCVTRGDSNCSTPLGSFIGSLVIQTSSENVFKANSTTPSYTVDIGGIWSCTGRKKMFKTVISRVTKLIQWCNILTIE